MNDDAHHDTLRRHAGEMGGGGKNCPYKAIARLETSQSADDRHRERRKRPLGNDYIRAARLYSCFLTLPVHVSGIVSGALDAPATD